MQPQGRAEDASAWGILPAVRREGEMVSGAVFYALADTLPLWKVPLVVGLILLVTALVMLAFEAYRDD